MYSCSSEKGARWMSPNVGNIIPIEQKTTDSKLTPTAFLLEDLPLDLFHSFIPSQLLHSRLKRKLASKQ